MQTVVVDEKEGRAPNPWINCPRMDAGGSIRLFCFPYAGGGASAFREWRALAPEHITVCAVNLPGREKRIAEPLFNRLEPLADALAEAIAPYASEPYALFGHSMGSWLAYETAVRLRTRGLPPPARLFLSGRRAPQLLRRPEGFYALPKRDLIGKLRDLQGMSEEILNSAALMELLLPIIRADFEAVETYIYREQPALECPITALGGAEDAEASFEDLAAWAQRTQVEFQIHLFPGGHFYLHASQAALLDTIGRRLRPQSASGERRESQTEELSAARARSFTEDAKFVTR